MRDIYYEHLLPQYFPLRLTWVNVNAFWTYSLDHNHLDTFLYLQMPLICIFIYPLYLMGEIKHDAIINKIQQYLLKRN